MYYMNKPCKVIREVSEDISEIIIFPEYIGDIELCGSQWCTPCQIGGTSTHTHENYDDAISEVLEVIQDVKQEPVVMMVYNKHIHEKQEQIETIISLEEFIEELKSEIKEKKVVKQNLVNYEIKLKNIEGIIATKKEEYEYCKKLDQHETIKLESIRNLEFKEKRLNADIEQNEKLIKVQNVGKNDISITISMTEFNRLMSLESGVRITQDKLERFENLEHKMLALEHGGVDNWEWYGESISNYEKENDIEL